MLDKVKDYQLISLLGKGAYGSVYKAKKIKTGGLFAIKIFDTHKSTPDDIVSINNEINILSSLNCEYIVKLYEHFSEIKSKGEKYYCIVMELCENGDLGSLILKKKKERSHFTEEEIRNILLQICKGLDYLHSNKIIHRDLKSMNILISKKNSIKIGDFGVSKVLKSGFANTLVGTPYYLSPEICQEKEYDEKSDIWSLGCIVYEMITLNKPFESNNQVGLLMKIIKGIPEVIMSDVKSRYSDQLFNIVNGFLEKRVNKRLTIDKAIEKLMNKGKENSSNDISSKINDRTNVKHVSQIRKRDTSKEIKSKRVRQPPKSKTMETNDTNSRIINKKQASTHQLSRQALLAYELQKKNLINQPIINKRDESPIRKKEIKVKESKSPNKNKVIPKPEKPMPKKKVIDKPKISNDDLSASHFMKNLLKSEYELICNKDKDNTLYEESNQEMEYDQEIKESIPSSTEDNDNNLIDNTIQDTMIYDDEEECKTNQNIPHSKTMIDPNSIPSKDRFCNLYPAEQTYTDQFPDYNDFVSDELVDESKPQENSQTEDSEKLDSLIMKAYNIIQPEEFDIIMSKYDECQMNQEEALTNELDKYILSCCKYDNEKYTSFLKIFYEIIYNKFLQDIESN